MLVNSRVFPILILGIQHDILASMKRNVREQQFVEVDTISNSCLPQNILSAKETDILKLYHKNGNLPKNDLRLVKELLLKSYTGTLSKEDQIGHTAYNSDYSQQEAADTTCSLQPFVWSHNVET